MPDQDIRLDSRLFHRGCLFIARSLNCLVLVPVAKMQNRWFVWFVKCKQKLNICRQVQIENLPIGQPGFNVLNFVHFLVLNVYHTVVWYYHFKMCLNVLNALQLTR